jgi:peptide/nickel transport system substrate-binding protein
MKLTIRYTCQHLRRFSLVWLLAMLVSACAEQAAPPVPAQPPTAQAQQLSVRGSGDQLRLISWIAPTTLNPHISAGLSDFLASRITYEPLASFDKDGRLIPFLAAEIPNRENGGVAADGLSVTWKLKQGVRWSDGEPFTADDVRFTYEFITNPAVSSHARFAYTAVRSVDVADTATVVVRFKAPNTAWAIPFVGRYGLILPRHLFAQYNGNNYRDAPANILPAGTGPYRVTSFKPQEVLFLVDKLVKTNKIVYEPNPFFREPDKPYFSQVELRGWGLPELSASAVLVDGTADYVYDVQMPDVALQRMEARGKGVASINFGSQLLLIALNTTDPGRGSSAVPQPFLSDARVRQAIAHAINREAIARTVYGRSGRAAGALLIAPGPDQLRDTAYDYNLTQAAALLDAAGWVDSDGDGIRDKSGARLHVTYQAAAGSLPQAIQEIVKQNLEAVGFEVSLDVVDAAVLQVGYQSKPDTLERFPADMQQYLISSSQPDPGAYLQRWTCAQIPAPANDWRGANTSRWCDPAYDALYEQSIRELDEGKRNQLFNQMNDLLIRDGFVIPVAQVANVSGVSTTIQGMEWTPWDAEVWNIKDWTRRSSP